MEEERDDGGMGEAGCEESGGDVRERVRVEKGTGMEGRGEF